MGADITQCIEMAISMFTRVLSWEFTAFGYTMTVSDFFACLATFAIVVWFLEWLANARNATKFFQFFGGE